MVVGEISQERELVIIGGGPGGYTAAIRGAQLGLSVTLIEQSTIGGTCLNEGCIPSKVFTHAAAMRSETAHLQELGIGDGDDSFNINRLLSYKTTVVAGLRLGVESLCKENKIEIIRGKATFLAENRIGVENGHQFDVFEFNQAIIATGSSPIMPPVLGTKGERVLLAHEVFELEELPEHLIVIGYDYIAIEVASSYAALGSKVTVLFDSKESVPFDESIEKEMQRLFKKRKMTVINDAVIITTNEIDEGISITMQTTRNGEETIYGTHLYVSGSRKPNVKPVGIERFGIALTEEGFISIDENMQTSLPSIYAIGDVTEGPLLAIKAIKQGKAAVEAIAGKNPEVDLTFVPVVVHTIPPIAAVGLTEKNARDLGLEVQVSQTSLRSNGYAAITNKKDGFIKVISDSSTDIIVGIHMIGEGAIEMAGTFVQLLEMVAKEEDIRFPSYVHPGFNEGLLEVVEELIGQGIYTAPKSRIKMQTT